MEDHDNTSDSGRLGRLSEIGIEILSLLSAEQINELVYEKIQGLMPADVFGIAEYNHEQNHLFFGAIIEKGEKMSATVSLEEEARPGVWCFKNKQHLLINDWDIDYPKYFFSAKPLKIVTGGGTQSLVYAPLISKGAVLGVITVQSFHKNAFRDADIEILKNLSVYIATALNNARIHHKTEEEVEARTKEVMRQKEELQRIYEHTRLLSEIGRKISSSLSVEEIINETYASLRDLMDAQIFGIAVSNLHKADTLDFYVKEYNENFGPFSVDLRDNTLPASVCYNKQELVFLNDFLSDIKKINPHFSKPLVGKVVGALMYVPLTQKGKKIGVITVQHYEKNVFTEQHVNILNNLAVYVASAIENAILYTRMEEAVQQRTEEVVRQKEKVETALQHVRVLDELGKEITATLDFEVIFSKLHESVSNLMAADIFGVRLYEAEKNQVNVKYEIVHGKRDDGFTFSMDNKNNYSVWCIENRKDIIINDQAAEYKNYVNEMVVLGDTPSESLMFCPVILGDQILGVVTAQSYKKNQYSNEHLHMLKTLANYTSIALQNAEKFEKLNQLKHEIERSFKNISVLGQIGQRITSTLNLDKILDTLYDHVNQLMDATEFGVSIYDEEKNALRSDYYIFEGKRMADEDVYVSLDSPNRLSAWSARNRREIFTNDIQKEYLNYIPDLKAYEEGAEGAFLMGSLMYLPLIIENRLIGGISVQSPKTNAYTPLHLEMFRTLASYTAVALNNAEAYQHLNRSNSRLIDSYRNIEILGRIGQKITSTLDLDNILEVVYNNINQLMDATEFGVGIYNKESATINLGYYIYEGKRMHYSGASGIVSMNDDRRLSVWCVKNTKEVFINDIEREFIRYISSLEAYTSEGVLLMNSMMCLPLMMEGKVIGIISVQSPAKNAYTEVHLEMFKTIASYTAVALNNAEAYHRLNSAMHEVEKLSVVASKTNNSVIIFGSDLELVWANEAFSQNSGYMFEDIKGSQSASIYEMSAKAEIRDLVDHCIARKRSVSYDSMNVSRTGEKKWYHTTLTPVFDEAGLLKNIVAIDADITQIKLVEELLLQKNKDITDSINYALRIQNSILPSKDRIKELLPDSFVFYRPRDIVSGDFYWVEAVDNNTRVMVAAVDCTGHGVPGAFLTIVGNSLLNQIVNEQNITDPRQVILKMNQGIVKRLSVTKGDNIRDGMDMSICVFNRNSEELELVCSGAYNPVCYYTANELKETTPVRTSVGSINEEEATQVSSEVVRLRKGDTIYLSTDGFPDQLGGLKGKKFMYGKFKKLLSGMNEEKMKMYDQKVRLKKEMENWKGGFEQTDDILVIGIRL